MGNAPAEVWEQNSNMSVAANLTGKLLLIHGDIDDNVPVTESMRLADALIRAGRDVDRSEEHTSELQSLMRISYAVFCLEKKITHRRTKKKTYITRIKRRDPV